MLPLPAGGHLVPLVLEVEGMGVIWIIRVRHHVERLDGRRIAGQEVELVALLGHALSEQFLPLRVDVVPVPDAFALASKDLKCLAVGDSFERELWPRR